MDEIEALVQQKIEADTEFQSSLENLEDDEREQLVSAKRSEVISSEFASLREQAEKAAKAEELAENYKRRAEKAEKAEKNGTKAPSNEPGLDNKDILYLAKADIHEDDVDEVLEYAKFKKVPVKEAHALMKDMLSVRQEQRKTANATNTTTSTRSGNKVDPSILLQNASAGKLPEDDAGIQALVDAEMAEKTRK